MADQLQQINCKYSPEEDRVIMELSTSGQSAFRLWLTRRFVQLFWQTIRKSIEGKPAVAKQTETNTKKAVMKFQEKEALEKADFKTEYKSNDLTYPLGVTPMLPITISYASMGRISRYTFKALDGKAVTFNLNQQLLYSLSHMLMAATQKAKWDLDLNLTDVDTIGPAISNQLH